MLNDKTTPDNAITGDNIAIIVLIASLFFAFLAASVVYFVVLYRNRQLKNKQEKEEREALYQQELLKTQIEMQEQTLEHISKEIHDNVTQVLSFIKLTLGAVANSLNDERKTKINENRELLSQTINDLRDLSKSMSFEHIKSLGLAKTIKKEVERINKSGVVGAHLSIEGDVYSLGEQRELVLFRILQEGFNNALKHSGAKNFYIDMAYAPEQVTLSLKDDGVGFSAETMENKSGSGLRNIKNRAMLIDGDAYIESSPGKGCQVVVTVSPPRQLRLA
jgi:signal transduction histidine kinase